MTGAARKAKMSKYVVTIRRQIEQVAVLEVEARNAEEAADVAMTSVDGAGASHWSEGVIISQDAKAKIIR